MIPCTDSYKKVDLRTVSFDVPPQEVLDGHDNYDDHDDHDDSRFPSKRLRWPTE